MSWRIGHKPMSMDFPGLVTHDISDKGTDALAFMGWNDDGFVHGGPRGTTMPWSAKIAAANGCRFPIREPNL